jgi:hypothetical protein
VVEQGTHKPLVGSSTLPPGTAWLSVVGSQLSVREEQSSDRRTILDKGVIVLVVVVVLVLDRWLVPGGPYRHFGVGSSIDASLLSY